MASNDAASRPLHHHLVTAPRLLTIQGKHVVQTWVLMASLHLKLHFGAQHARLLVSTAQSLHHNVGHVLALVGGRILVVTVHDYAIVKAR